MIGNVRQLFTRVSPFRQLCTSVLSRQPFKPKENAGVSRRLKLISESEPDIEKADIDHRSIEELEEDFMNAEDIHDSIMGEIRNISKTQEFKITERKHFRSPKEPGMLTWSEKEQIRFLHQSDSEKWTAEVLAESFPASPAIIRKMLRWKWKPATAERLKAHDRQVSKNWISFHKGELEVHDPRLKAHLSKFTDRKDGVKLISDEEAKKITEVIMPRPKNTEFLSLITSFKHKDCKEKPEEITYLGNEPQNVKQLEKANPLSVIESSKANYTLDRFRQRIEHEINKMTDLPSEELKSIIKTRKPEVQETTQKYVAPSERFKTDAIVYQKSEKSPLTLADPNNLPNRIRIPKAQQKPGLLYRVNDCFYNHKGYFLYKVPGLNP